MTDIYKDRLISISILQQFNDDENYLLYHTDISQVWTLVTGLFEQLTNAIIFLCLVA